MPSTPDPRLRFSRWEPLEQHVLSQAYHTPELMGVQYFKINYKAVNQKSPHSPLPPVNTASLALHNHFAHTLGPWTTLWVRGGDLTRPPLPPISGVSRWDLLGKGVQGSWVSESAHLRSLFIIDLLHDTQEKHFILETAGSLCASWSPPHAAQGRRKSPHLCCQSSSCTATKAFRKLSKPLKIYTGLQEYIFLWSILWFGCSGEAATENGNKGAEGECRTGLCLSQPARERQGALEAGLRLDVTPQLPSKLVFPSLWFATRWEPLPPNPLLNHKYPGKAPCAGGTVQIFLCQAGTCVLCRLKSGVSWKQPGYF